MKKETRKKIAWILFAGSSAGMVANTVAYLAGWIGQEQMVFITLVLSWLAIQLSALDAIFIVESEDG